MIEWTSKNLVIKFKFKSDVFPPLFAEFILIFAHNAKIAILFNNLANLVNKSVVGLNLLPDETIFKEVAVNYLPSMAFVDFLLLNLHIKFINIKNGSKFGINYRFI